MGGDNRVDDVPDGREDEVTRTDLPVSRPHATGPATGQVRIIGAEPAGEVTGELPRVAPLDPDEGLDLAGLPADDAAADQPSVRLTDQPAHTEPSIAAVRPVNPGETAVPTGTPTELPHWTEPPTGQVPAVLARENGEEGGGIEGPSWREEDADWVAHEELFDPAMFGDDEAALGSLDETDSTDLERRPWEFELRPTGSTPRVGAQADSEATAHPITEPVEAVTSDTTTGAEVVPREPPVSAPRSVGSGGVVGAASVAMGVVGAASLGSEHPGPDAPDAVVDDAEPHPEPVLPTGTERVERPRRSGLLTARIRAKRPDGVEADDGAPELPGASVTDVPGAGRRKRDTAGLAADDRTAEQDAGAATDADSAAAGTEVAEVAIVAGATGRRSFRRRPSPPDTPDASAVPVRPAAGRTAPDGPTGGGPPSPDRARRPRPDGDARPGRSSIGLRVGTGVAVAIVALLAFKLGTVASLVLVVIVVTFAAGECFGVLRRAGYHPATLLGLVGTISLTVGAYSKGIAALPLVLVLITVFTLVWYLFGIERGSPVAGTAATLLAVGWVSLLGSYAGLLLSPSTFPDRHGIAFLLGAIIATVANDVGALVVGGWMGRTPLAPTISPNKTWEGLLGGAVFSILVSTVVVGAIHPWSASNAALLGVVVAVVAPIGDLCESLLKRDLRLKDMGTLLPGHGGVLDRVDALLFVLPATYYLVRALNIA
jgi:CDP-diglyceride synthetase